MPALKAEWSVSGSLRNKLHTIKPAGRMAGPADFRETEGHCHEMRVRVVTITTPLLPKNPNEHATPLDAGFSRQQRVTSRP
jgi:hypothetical protein